MAKQHENKHVDQLMRRGFTVHHNGSGYKATMDYVSGRDDADHRMDVDVNQDTDVAVLRRKQRKGLRWVVVRTEKANEEYIIGEVVKHLTRSK